MPNDANAGIVSAVWGWFTTFPVDLALGVQYWVLFISCVLAAVIIVRRRARDFELVQFAVPLGLTFIAQILQWVALGIRTLGSAEIAGGIMVVFALVMLGALLWTIVNTVRVLSKAFGRKS